MVQARDFELDGIQVSAWVSSTELQPHRTYGHVFQRLGETFNAAPEFQPQDGLPPEFPVFTIGSNDLQWRLEVAKTRVNIYWRRVADEHRDIGPTLQVLGEYVSGIFEFNEAKIGRLAAVTARAARNEQPAQEIARHFFSERWLRAPFNRPESLEIHSHKVFALTEAMNVNSWVRVKSGQRIGPTSPGPVVVIEQDVNTLDEDRVSRELQSTDVAQFLTVASVELEHILGLYFPNEGHSERDADNASN